MHVLSKKTFEQEWGGNVAKTELVTVNVERGLSWERAMDVWRDHLGSDDGFYTGINVSHNLYFCTGINVSHSLLVLLHWYKRKS